MRSLPNILIAGTANQLARVFTLCLVFKVCNSVLILYFILLGTPGVGKSTLAQQISEETGLEWLDVSQIAKENKCVEGYDPTYGCHVLNEEKVKTLRTLHLHFGKCATKFEQHLKKTLRYSPSR